MVGIAVDTMVPSIDARNIPEMTATVVSTTRFFVRREAYAVTAGAPDAYASAADLVAVTTALA
jgi:hypothetical protein